MNRKQRRNFAKILLKNQFNTPQRERYNRMLEIFKGMNLEECEAKAGEKMSSTDKAALRDAIAHHKKGETNE